MQASARIRPAVARPFKQLHIEERECHQKKAVLRGHESEKSFRGQIVPEQKRFHLLADKRYLAGRQVRENLADKLLAYSRAAKLVLICAPQHPLATSKRAPLRAIAGQRFVGFEKDIPTRKGIDRMLQQHGVGVESVMEFDNIETVKRAVEIDAGISIVPQGTVVQEVSNRTLATVDIQGGQFYRPVAAIYRRDKVLSPAMQQFLNMLKG